MQDLRVLDLACLEGQFGVEFALQNSQVLAIEGRDQNLAKAQFVKSILSIENMELLLDDVVNLSEMKHGHFDVVLCLGILYHLNTPDVMNLLRAIYKVCTHVAIIDTHISLVADASYTWEEKHIGVNISLNMIAKLHPNKKNHCFGNRSTTSRLLNSPARRYATCLDISALALCTNVSIRLSITTRTGPLAPKENMWYGETV